jgi:hypothetical protein
MVHEHYGLVDFEKFCRTPVNHVILESHKPALLCYGREPLGSNLHGLLRNLNQRALDLLAVISMFNSQSIPESILCGGDNIVSATLADSLHYNSTYLESVSVLTIVVSFTEMRGHQRSQSIAS